MIGGALTVVVPLLINLIGFEYLWAKIAAIWQLLRRASVN
jgi:hypothetical protein